MSSPYDDNEGGGPPPDRGSPPRRSSRPRSRSRSYSPPPPRRRSRSRSPPPSRGYHRGGRDRSYSPPPRYGPRYGGGGRDRDYPPPPPRHGPRYGGGGGYGPPPPRDFRPGPPRHGPRRDEGPPGVSLLVRNVSPAITSHDLHQAFGRIGEIRDVYIPRDYHSQQPKGFAFIEYATIGQAQDAREEMDRFVIKGRALDVVFAQEKRKTPGEMRGRVVNQQNRGRERSNFDRSSSFERARQHQRQEGKKEANKQDPEDKQDRKDG